MNAIIEYFNVVNYTMILTYIQFNKNIAFSSFLKIFNYINNIINKRIMDG